jgi:hypothetical protein
MRRKETPHSALILHVEPLEPRPSGRLAANDLKKPSMEEEELSRLPCVFGREIEISGGPERWF